MSGLIGYPRSYGTALPPSVATALRKLGFISDSDVGLYEKHYVAIEEPSYPRDAVEQECYPAVFVEYRKMTNLHEQFNSFSNALNTWLTVLDKAQTEGVGKIEDGYFTANPEWISNAITVFRLTIIESGPPWGPWRWRLDTLDDHIRHFLDADLTWSEALVESNALDQLFLEIKRLREQLATSDIELDAAWDAEWNWTR